MQLRICVSAIFSSGTFQIDATPDDFCVSIIKSAILPTFYRPDPEFRLKQVEAAFYRNKIREDETKFYICVIKMERDRILGLAQETTQEEQLQQQRGRNLIGRLSGRDEVCERHGCVSMSMLTRWFSWACFLIL